MFVFSKIIVAVGKFLRRLLVALYGNADTVRTGKFRRKSGEIQHITGRGPEWAEDNPGAALWEDADHDLMAGERFPYTLAVHRVGSRAAGHNPHCHQIFSERAERSPLAGERFPYTLAVHRVDSRTEGRNSHRHQIFSKRVERPPQMWFRKAWTEFAKDALARRGSDVRNDDPSPDE